MDEAFHRLLPPAAWLAALWTAESFAGIVPRRHTERIRHAGRNLALAAVNGATLFFTLGALSIWVGIVSPVTVPPRWTLAHTVVCFLALDLYSYAWHRLMHAVPALWRLHEVHHSDDRMDATTSGRFHVCELALAGTVRLPLLFVLGATPATLLVYETALVGVSMFHHANLSLGSTDRFLRLAIASPRMHSIHHSRDAVDFGTNYGSVLSIWDRVFRTFRITDGPIIHGLDERDDDPFPTLLRRPF